MNRDQFNNMESAIHSVYPVLMVLSDLLSNPDVCMVDTGPYGIAWILQKAADTLKDTVKETPSNNEEVAP